MLLKDVFLSKPPQTTTGNKKPVGLIKYGTTGLVRLLVNLNVVERGGIEPPSKKPTSSVLHA